MEQESAIRVRSRKGNKDSMLVVEEDTRMNGFGKRMRGKEIGADDAPSSQEVCKDRSSQMDVASVPHESSPLHSTDDPQMKDELAILLEEVARTKEMICTYQKILADKAKEPASANEELENRKRDERIGFLDLIASNRRDLADLWKKIVQINEKKNRFEGSRIDQTDQAKIKIDLDGLRGDIKNDAAPSTTQANIETRLENIVRELIELQTAREGMN